MAADGKMFCAFVALIARMCIESELTRWMQGNRKDMERVHRGLEKIRCVLGDEVLVGFRSAL